MTLSELIESWVVDAERMNGSPARGLVVTKELFAHLATEQASLCPEVAGHPALVAATVEREMIEIDGPDRVCIYVGVAPDESAMPLGFDPAMPVVFVPVPPNTVADDTAAEMYNRLRWYGLGPEEALTGSG